MIDIGINLASETFNHDREQVVADAKSAGVEFIIVTGSCPTSNEFARTFAHQHANFARGTVGIHPHHADSVTSSTLQDIKSQAQDSMVVALGETGLDFCRNRSTPQKQEWAFEQHLEIAAELQLPLFLHQRDAHERFLPLIKAYRNHISKAVVHCFTDSRQALFDYLDLDLHIGITGWVADERRGTHLLPLLASIPTDRLMIETDGPYLLPRNIQPKPKSRRNEPKYLPFVVQKIAQTLKTSDQVIAEQTSKTARAFFNLP